MMGRPPLPLPLLLLLPGRAGATKPHLCGPACGPLFATYPHNDSCWRPSTQTFFSFAVQPHYHVSDRCFGENDPCAPFYYKGVYHMMWQSHTQYIHVPAWNTLPAGQFGDTGISFGHAVSKDLAHWTQVENALWPDEWFTSVSVYDGSATVIDGLGPIIIAAGLTPNTSSVFCHARATPADLSDENLVDWSWDTEPLYCGNATNGLTPFDAPSGAWQTPLKQWQYVDGKGNIFVSDDGVAWRGALPAGGRQFPGGAVSDFFALPRVCDGCGTAETAAAAPGWLHYNDTDLACADNPSENFKLPKGTSDADGKAQCAAFCGNHSDCGGYVYVSGAPGTPTPGGPRCAIKGHGGCCPGMSRGGCFSAIKEGECHHPTPSPPAPPRPPAGPPTHVHEGGNNYQLVHFTPGAARDEAGTVSAVADGGATIASAAAFEGFVPRCDHGSFGFPKSFEDPVKRRRLQYGWVRGPGLQGEDDATLGSTGLSLKSNHQSLLREVTYDPRLGMLNFFPIDELALLRGKRLAAILPGTRVPAGGVLPLGGPDTHGGAANQSEIRVSFAVPRSAVTLGVRVMCGSDGVGFDVAVDFVPPAAPGAQSWAVQAGGQTLPLLATDEAIELALFVDHTVVEAFFMRGRLAMTSHFAQGLLQPGNNSQQSVEIFATGGPGARVLNASMWAVSDIWDPATHGRPHQKPGASN